MAIYSGDFVTTVTGSGAPAMDFRGASANAPKIMEMAIVLAAATASTYAILRSANSPTQTSTNVLVAEDPGNAAAGQTTQAVTWSTAPTAPTVYYRRSVLPATVGAGVVYTWPRGLGIAPAGATIVIWNSAINSASMNVRVVVDE
jgi:hypothetical protein